MGAKCSVAPNLNERRGTETNEVQHIGRFCRRVDLCFAFLRVCARRTCSALSLRRASMGSSATRAASPMRLGLALGTWAPQSLRNLGARPLRSELGEPATPRRALGGTVTEPTARGTAQPAARSTVIQSWIAINQIWRTRVQRYAQHNFGVVPATPAGRVSPHDRAPVPVRGVTSATLRQPAAADAFPHARA